MLRRVARAGLALMLLGAGCSSSGNSRPAGPAGAGTTAAAATAIDAWARSAWQRYTDAQSGISFASPARPRRETTSTSGVEGRTYSIGDEAGLSQFVMVSDFPSASAAAQFLQSYVEGFASRLQERTGGGASDLAVSPPETVSTNGVEAVDREVRLTLSGTRALWLNRVLASGAHVVIMQTGYTASAEAVGRDAPDLRALHQRFTSGLRLPRG